jgi:hypothetical protein
MMPWVSLYRASSWERASGTLSFSDVGNGADVGGAVTAKVVGQLTTGMLTVIRPGDGERGSVVAGAFVVGTDPVAG